MATEIKIVPQVPFDNGKKAGEKLGVNGLEKEIEELLGGEYLGETLGEMSRKALTTYTMDRLHTEPDYSRYPELEDIYPERLDYLRGVAEGAGCDVELAAVHSYTNFRRETEEWYQSYQPPYREPHRDRPGCSGVLLVGPDGVLGGKSAESLPLQEKPEDYQFSPPPPHAEWSAEDPVRPDQLVLKKPRTGYITGWGTTNEKGVGSVASVSCGTWLDEPIEDTWPIGRVPLLRFARTLDHLVELYRRYTLHNWGRASQIWADTDGNAAAIEKSFRRIGVRRMSGHAIWVTEGHFQTDHMHEFIRSRRLEYLRRTDSHLGAGHMQYATDCAVRFTHIGELCHADHGRGLKHMNRTLTDHSTFPRAVCRHGGPDTDVYDRTVTMLSGMTDLTHNRTYKRSWIPWEKFPCELPWQVTQHPARP